MKNTNTKKLGISEMPTGSEMVSEHSRPEVMGNTSESVVIELPTHKQKQTQEENRMLR